MARWNFARHDTHGRCAGAGATALALWHRGLSACGANLSSSRMNSAEMSRPFYSAYGDGRLRKCVLGYIDPAFGTIQQEGIDVIVTLNVLQSGHIPY